MVELEEYKGSFSTTELAQLYERMLLIRRFEERVLELFSLGELNGTTHAYIGEEAVAAGLFASLSEEDLVFSNHRCHGHYLMHQDDPVGLLAELMGKAGGICDGRGGSQHIHRHNFYTNGVQGGIVPNAVGMALALKLQAESAVTSEHRPVVVVFMGDGTLGEGQVYESFNMASLWQVPIVFVIENNYWAQSTPSSLAVAGSIAARPRAFAIPTIEVSSQDVLVTREAAAQAVAQCRQGNGPQALVFNTYRFCHHSKANDGRPSACVTPWLEHDPLRLASKRLAPPVVADIEQQVAERLAAAEAKVRTLPAACVPSSAPLPLPEVSCWNYDSTETGLSGQELSFAGQRVTKCLNQALQSKMAQDERVVLLGEDLIDPYGGAFKISKGLSTAYPSRVISTPLSEASMTGVAAGLALRGMRPVLEIMFGDFITLCFDQLVNYISKFRGMYNGSVSCPVVIRTPMGGRRGYGPTHSQTLDKFLLGLPDVRVVAPNLLVNPGKLLTIAIDDDAPVVFLENKLMYANVCRGLQACARPEHLLTKDRAARYYESDEWLVRQNSGCYPTFSLSLVEFSRADCVIVAYGGMLELAMQAALRLLMEQELVCEIVAPTLLSSCDLPELTEALARSHGRIVTVEEGSGFASWGSEIIAQLANSGLNLNSVGRCSAPLVPIPTAISLEKQVLPEVEDIKACVEQTCQ